MSDPVELMVLDDEPVVCERLREHFEKKNYRVEVFTDSQAAVDRLSRKHFDVVITDLKMEGPDGLDVLRFVRDKGSGTQVIIITGYGSIENVREAEYSGVYGFVNKPFSMKALEEMAGKAAKRARKHKSREG